jgi:AcrR family transcriptional regulator
MRALLILAAREAFVSDGFANASTPDIVARANVTRGALYHHFPEKTELLRAVIETEMESVSAEISKADIRGKTALERLLLGAEFYLEAMAKPGRVRLLLVEGPAALGAQTLAEIESHYAEHQLKQGIEETIAEGDFVPRDAEVLASLLSALFERAARDQSEGANTEEVLKVIRAMINGLR